MKRVEICSDVFNGIARNVYAYIKNGGLEIEGQDLGEGVPGGDGEYEYFYSFNQEETRRFAKLLTGSSDNLDEFLDALVKLVGGSMWYFKFFDYVRKHELKYTAFSC